jgi:hypothetical protein
LVGQQEESPGLTEWQFGLLNTMKIGIMQPYFFPYLGYFQLIHAVDRFLLYPHVQHIRDGWINRNRILIKWGEPIFIHAPIQPCSRDTLIRDVLIDHQDGAWRRRILRMLHHNYATSKFYPKVQPLIEEILNPNIPDLSSLNCRLVAKIASAIGLNTEIVCAGKEYWEIEQSLAVDAEQDGLPAGVDKKSARIQRLCQKEGADTYINAIGGLELYSKSLFKTLGLELLFLSPGEDSYPQFATEFQPRLSIIDVLMHNGFTATGKLAQNYSLI